MDRGTFIKIRCYLTMNARKRTRYLIRKKIFREVGDHFVFFPRKIPQDPKLIKFHNNVVVATEVMFVNHDIIHEMINGMPFSKSGLEEECLKKWGCIEIKDNVFIGARAMIMPGVTLGPDVIVAAGSVVHKSFSGGVIIGGNPARIIGDMESLITRRREESMIRSGNLSKDEEAERAWKQWQEKVRE